MANLVFNSVYLLGSPHTLMTLAEVIEQLMNDSPTHNTTLEALQEQIGLECAGWGRSDDCGLYNINTKEIEDGKLYLDVCTAWNGVPDYWNALCKKYNLQYAALIDYDGGIYVENDREKRYFPEEYRLDIWDENQYVEAFSEESESLENFESMDDLATHIYEQLGLSIEEYKERLEEDDIGQIIEIERDGQQAIIQNCA